MNTLKEALMLFDNPEKKHFHYFDVSNAIAQLPEEITTSFEAQAEYLAMSFQDNRQYRRETLEYIPWTYVHMGA